MILNNAKDVFMVELESIKATMSVLNNDFVTAVNMIKNCSGKVVLIGMGKSGHVARKISSTMSSIGICSCFLQAAEGLHGDIGQVREADVLIMLSNSGETSEVIQLFPSIGRAGCKVISIVGRPGSTLEKFSTVSIVLPKIEEAFLGDIVPTSSTTAMMVVGDALSVCASKENGFTKNDFAMYHPNGTLGKKLTLKVSDIMITNNAVIKDDGSIQDAIYEMCEKPMCGVNIVNKSGHLLGILTDGDLKKSINSGATLDGCISNYMTKNPICVSSGEMAASVVSKMMVNGKYISMLPVVDNGVLVGAITLSQIVEIGFL